MPKAEAAARKLRAINTSVEVEAVVADINHTNVLGLVGDADVILDGTDNFEVRYLINDAAVKLGKPWVYGGCLASHGQTTTIIPGETPCLRCTFEAAPAPGEMGTCETAGVLASAVHVVASLQATDALKILLGRRDLVNRELLYIDVWEGTFRKFKISGVRDLADCPCCRHGRFEWLDGALGSQTTRLCGRNAVQVSPGAGARLDFETLVRSLTGITGLTENRFLVRFAVDGCQFSVFPDGRAIIQGTDDVERARALYAKYIGH
jgi:adenylyltransferase/sulfurtransferase